ncbi:hypothetical protein GCM10010912_38540 [Paenibacillus albidus]|uniref:Uncharacterized protein n=1 Tax=Paenibacillus albidus TaxID=2041023 RepID=A0A917CIF9_9BACL|nr:hypothetical protein [Paenibacillus albidus]GGF89669.1 hypothetical protein GCM10010912_38540 [Paenibacillus albidus]
MTKLSNEKYRLEFNEHGALQTLVLQDDPHAMNWVVDPAYLDKLGYPDQDKLFGEWTLQMDGKEVQSTALQPKIVREGEHRVTVEFNHEPLSLRLEYTLEQGRLLWTVEAQNRSDRPVTLNGLHVWFPLSSIMFRDKNVLRNMHESCAVFTHLGGDFTKFAAVRRSNEAPHLGVYGIEGRTAAAGTYCRYKNAFLEQVSPSLDGLLFHRLSLVEDGRSMAESAAADWIYGNAYYPLELEAGRLVRWTYVMLPFRNMDDFYLRGQELGHPRWTYTPALPREGVFRAELDLPEGVSLSKLRLVSAPAGTGDLREEEITHRLQPVNEAGGRYRLSLPRHEAGEHKLELFLEDGRTDILVWNVLEPIRTMLGKRAEWLTANSYLGEEAAERPHAFRPLSNQGESLGKVAFLLMNNRMSTAVPEQVAKAEAAAVHDIRQHWFEAGDFSRPRPLYGDFYRIYDFDYIGHVFYLLSQMDEDLLKLHSPKVYLQWAAEVMCLRLDPECHPGPREKAESRLNGIFILYLEDLLQALQQAGLTVWQERLLKLWEGFGRTLAMDARGYSGAITEHFYDNAGFGPTCETLCRLGIMDEAGRYGQLVLANIGFSNDYRLQNPDRWWEALSPMIHSLWGGLVSASALAAYEHLGNPQYLEAAYRSTVAVFHCYDWNVRSTPRRLQPGEAASTYSVSAPNLNMPKLSRNRFGQSVFVSAEDPLFASLFSELSGDDWDMGEELAAYLLGFGTTAYLYRDSRGIMRCVNGDLTEEEGGLTITSYAAYPSRYVLLEDGLDYRLPQGSLQSRVQLKDGKFRMLE